MLRMEMVMRGSIPPVTIPPGQPPGQVQPFVPGSGELFKAVLSRGYGAGQIKKLLRARGLSNAMATHRLPDVKRYFVGKPIGFVSAWLEQNNLSKLKPIFEDLFNTNCNFNLLNATLSFSVVRS